MTDDQRIEKLENRVDRMEDAVWEKLNGIDAKLSDLKTALAGRRECPSPGACLDLKDRVVRLESTHDNLAKTVSDLIRWRAWLTGINLVISTVTLILLGGAVTYLFRLL
jgi:hypothetical protein